MEEILNHLNDNYEGLVSIAKGRKNIEREISSYILIKNSYVTKRFDEEFKRTYKWFYKLDSAGLGDAIKKRNFQLIEASANDISIILSDIYDIPTVSGYHSIQLSFASKIMHTVDNSKPIYDKNVANILHLKKPLPSTYSKEERIKSAVEVFDELESKFNQILNSETGKKIIREFYKIDIKDIDKVPETKALDFAFWILGA